MQISSVRRHVTAVLYAAVLVALTAHAEAASFDGRVESGGAPIVGARVALYRAAAVEDGRATELGSAVTDANGRFQIDGPSVSANDVVYYAAHGGRWRDRLGQSAFTTLAAIAGTSGRVVRNAVVNERTTVAFGYALAHFAHGRNVTGKAPGLQNAAATAGNLADVATGTIALVLGRKPNGTATSTMPEFNSLANLLASCVEATDAAPCLSLMRLASGATAAAPSDTLDAIESIARTPSRNVGPLFALSATSRAYAPYLTSRVGLNAWTIAVAYEGNGHEFDGPASLAVDEDGNLWVPNNYAFSPFPSKPACSGEELIKLTPTGSDAPLAPFTGGGIQGAGFGAALDRFGTAWVANFGFAGTGCTMKPSADSVSRFTAAGKPLSPAGTGYNEGELSGPQGIAFDQKGDLWIASNKRGADGRFGVSVYRHGDPEAARRFVSDKFHAPFGVAIDAEGHVWVTNLGVTVGATTLGSSVVELSSDGSILRTFGERGSSTEGMFLRPLGVAIDRHGNVWVANQGKSDIVMISPAGEAHAFSGGGLDGPWGIAVDGDDHVFVANFGGLTTHGSVLSEFSGQDCCGHDRRPGEPISPATGFTSDALTRMTGVTVDTAGNVWATDNWMRQQQSTNPGGHAVVEFVGLAAPVGAPMLGPVRKP